MADAAPLRTLAAADDTTVATSSTSAAAAEVSSLRVTHGHEADADAGEGLAVVKRINFSPICSHADDEAANGGGVDREMLFYDADLKIDVSANMHVVVGFRNALFTTRHVEDECDDDSTGRASPASRLAASMKQRGPDAQSALSVRIELQSLELLSDGSELQLEDDERVTDVKWIDDEHFSASYSSGVIRIFTRAGKLVLEQVCDCSI